MESEVCVLKVGPTKINEISSLEGGLQCSFDLMRTRGPQIETTAVTMAMVQASQFVSFKTIFLLCFKL